MTRLLCIGDLHLGAGTDYGREPGDRLRDQEAVWARALELAAEHDVDAVLFAGDAFHRRRPTPAEMIAFQRPLQAFAAEHNIDVLAIAGNHDCEAADLPTALDVFGRELDLHVKPGLWTTRGVTVATLPWTPVSRIVASRGGGDRDDVHREAADLLVATARELRSQMPAGRPAVLLLHWSISGASTPTGVATDDFHEVVLPIEDLQALGFDAVVAGHIHRPQALGTEDAAAPVLYTGSLAPVDFGEAASAHGCWLLESDDDGFQNLWLPIESRSFVTVDVDLTTDRHDELGVDETDALAAAIATHLPLDDTVVRIRYRATEDQARRIDWPKLRVLLAPAHKVYSITGEILRADRVRSVGVDEDLEPLAALDLWIDANDVNHARSPLVDVTAGYLEEVSA